MLGVKVKFFVPPGLTTVPVVTNGLGGLEDSGPFYDLSIDVRLAKGAKLLCEANLK